MFKWLIEPCACKTTQELEDLLEDLEKKIASLEASGSGLPQLNFSVEIKGEYNVYVSEYGIPEDGEFDPDLLEDIRQKLIEDFRLNKQKEA